MFKTTLLAAVVATASAQGLLAPGAIMAKRDFLASQSSGGLDIPSTKCISEVMSIVSSMPTPPPELLSFTPTGPVTDPCKISVPASLSDAFSSYESEAQSWYSDNSADLSSALSDCPQVSSAADGLNSICTKGSSGSGGSGSGSGSGSGDSGSSPSGSTNGVPKPTALAGVAVAAAGVLGAVAAL